MARLGDICVKITDGSHNPPQGIENSEFLMLSSKNVYDDKITFDEPRYLSEPDFAVEDKRTAINAGDVLLTIVGTVGRTAVVPEINIHLCLQRSVAVIKPKRDIISPRFLMYQLQSMRPYLEGEARGVAQKGIYLKQVENLQIKVFEPAKQQQIVSTLDKITDLISLRKQQLAKLDELVKARFVELFGATSADKCSKQIKDYAEVLGGYAFKSDMFCTNAVPVIRISNINNGCVDPDYDVCYDELFWEQNKRFRAEQNDILMAMSGATTGKAGLYKEDMPALINQRVACIRAKDGIACPMFLFVATQLEWMYDLIQETSAGCAQPNISGKQIENMPVPDATYEQQQQFAAFVEQTDKSKLAIQQSLDKLETLKRSLMQKYFG